MFKWITEIDQPPFEFNNENGEFRLKRLDSTVELNEMSPVCQLFASFDVILDHDALTILPTPNDHALETILNEVVPHYLDVKQIFIDGKLKEINVRSLKKESKKIVEDLLSNNIYPVIPELYRTKNLNLPTEPRKLKHYLVKLELIDPLFIEETEKIHNFFKSSFFTESGSIKLQPTGWKLNEHLKESVTIRAFSTFAKQIVLVVNEEDMRVVGLDIYG
ncbi:hypothetical protein [Tenuibacillus multivorans]|uniref:Uncharacterized protein n=1 Tax=Tenuibacillus multivorans TaxID=237069 RepID=A0A1H0EDI1_9BACI|nr:hypothetical protein [Tenuibacillus multivorans]GEL77202.1 hypothetical protein TMU01_14370 [Tenuibacillus multivorans]SDN80389.1 hypothetical protein SAMN05216498_3108 [Tenuibacillus multivorans]